MAEDLSPRLELESVAGVSQAQEVEEVVGNALAAPQVASQGVSDFGAHSITELYAHVQHHTPCEDDSELEGPVVSQRDEGARGVVNVSTGVEGLLSEQLKIEDSSLVEDANAAIGLLRRQLQEERHRRVAAEKECASLQSSRDKLENERGGLAAAKEELESERLEARLAQRETRAALRRAQEELARVRSSAAEASRELQRSREDLASATKGLEAARLELRQLQEDLALAQRDREELREDLARACSQMESLQLEKRVEVQRIYGELAEEQARAAAALRDLERGGSDLALAREELAKVRLEKEQALREKDAALRRVEEELQRCKARGARELALLSHEVGRAQREKQVAVQSAQEQLARVRTSLPVGQTWHFQLADGKWAPLNPRAILQDRSQYEVHFDHAVPKICPAGGRGGVTCSFGLPSHWTAQGSGVFRQIIQRAPRDESRSRFLRFLRPGTTRPSEWLTFGTVAQRITQDGMLADRFTTLLRDSVFHHEDRIPPSAGAACEALKGEINVCEVYHVENVSLYAAYQEHCQNMQLKHRVHGIVPGRISPEPNPALMELARQLGIQMWAPNELLLFHGTSSDAAERIALEGFDLHRAKNGLYGKGVYFASQSCKSHQYSRRGEALHTMVIARVALGDPYYCEQCDTSLTFPKSNFGGGVRCDSIFVEPGPMRGHPAGHQTHAEFIIFDKKQAYPEYIVKYRLS